MKKFIITSTFLACAVLASCTKIAGDAVNPNAGEEIVFTLGGEGLGLSVDTKAVTVTTISNLSKVYWEAKEGSSVKYPVCSLSVSYSSGTKGTVSTGKYWPKTSATYSYMVSNNSFTTSTGAMTVDNTKDVVAGTLSSVTGNTAEVTLDHILSRTGTLTLNTQSGYTLSDVSWTIQSKGAESGTKGTYTISSGSWGTTATTSLTETAITSGGDMWLLPGTYTIKVVYTLTKGAYVETFTKYADVTLVKGKVNNISGTATGGSASQITFSVSVAEWGSNNINSLSFRDSK